MQRRVITIVGGGFSGSMLAVQLARLPMTQRYACDVHLIEPRLTPGPGLAYTARRPEYLMNVQSRFLSAFPDQPDHFQNWLRITDADEYAQDFCSRQIYGRYLQQLTSQVLEWPSSNGIRCYWKAQTAVAIHIEDGSHKATVRLADGSEIESDYVVLAMGNFPPLPLAFPATLLHSSNYHNNPWAQGALRSIGLDDTVLLIGSGLTAVDVLLGLRADGHRGRIMVTSRHGRWPFVHEAYSEPYPSFYASELAGLTQVLAVVRVIRQHIRKASAAGSNWRAVIDSLRPHLGQIWAAWPLEEQARFLRHLAGLWSVIRHRSPPQNAALVETMLKDGTLQLETGRVREITSSGEGLQVTVQRPGQEPRHLIAAHVINCTGPLLDYSRISDCAVKSLRDAGHLTPDVLRLGIQTDEHGALITKEGNASPVLFTLGPSRRPAYFESTAIPELREQAVKLAQELGNRLLLAT
ncbi:FAD/NAD(P)-binding protein [Hymenobacter wooponensis]|uniref:FAD-dependent urate hydroxylase HpyO/Asp monooxygenase CreE-like FAD/NAD(P)-binding domain-containing protein n=1 Tax=Hymenobacter wooponensis TaxID=1525360 RepID=A0A4Z0MHB0_9BACT|nr:FAD/NAD(P)-binding protein [Hymenobacter wooponensis]TGD78730.1 hypothetical protein EU557_17235 [Hymenobacter wooponensis]